MAQHRTLLVALAVCTILAIGCNRNSSSEVASSTFDDLKNQTPSAAELKDLDFMEALAVANAWGRGEKGVTSFVDQRKISFEFSGGESVTVPLPLDKMVVAIAPFIEDTHPCEIHYMSGCQGEMVGVPVQVTGRAKDGTLLVDDTFTTMDNGFIELWLPRSLEIDLEIEAEGKRATETIGTFDDSNTCITTIRLL